MIDFSARLNPQQLAACTHHGTPLLILAGAGSGKTRVITHRIAYLFQDQGLAPRQLLAVTFTNKAAEEMRHRALALLAEAGLPGDAAPPQVATFHATCAALLRRHASHLGLTSRFSIYDDADQRALLRVCAERMQLPADRQSVRLMRGFIDGCKNRGESPEQAAAITAGTHQETLAEVYAAYQRALRGANAVDFGDLLVLVVRLLEEQPQLRARYRERWRHVLVDEFQDTNVVQYRLLRLLTADHQQVTVVGDDDQSIYAWRGANVENIHDFEKDYKEVRVVTLEQNYRSRAPILAVATSLISANHSRHPKRLWTAAQGGDPVEVYTALDGRDEAAHVARAIRAWRLEHGAAPDGVGVLFRTNAQARLIEEALRAERIAYRVVGGVAFYERAEVKDLLAYLSLLANPSDAVALRRIINVPARGIGARTLEQLEAFAREHTGGDLAVALEAVAAGRAREVSSAAARSLGGFHELLTRWRQLGRSSDDAARQPPADILVLEGMRPAPLPPAPELRFHHPAAVARAILHDTGYLDHLDRRDPDSARDRRDNLDELLAALDEFELQHAEEATLSAFLEQASLDRRPPDADDASEAPVLLMTIHSAKGLEFDLVLVTGLEEGLLPYMRRDEEPNIAEERRLGYVACTRARQRLVLSHAVRRRLHGSLREPRPSRFLDDIDSAELRRRRHPFIVEDPADGGFAEAPVDPLDAAPRRPPAAARHRPRQADAGSFSEGDTVTHPKFGVGVVIETRLSSGRVFVTVDFPMAGTKKILDRFLQML